MHNLNKIFKVKKETRDYLNRKVINHLNNLLIYFLLKFIPENRKLFKNLIDFYNSYFNYSKFKITYSEALNICRLAVRLNADLWKSINPMTEEEIQLFYKITPFYIFELTYGSMDIAHLFFLEKVFPYIKGKVLDFGGGSGFVTLYLVKKGFNVSYAEVPGITRDFGKFIFKKEKVKVKIIDLEDVNSGKVGKFDTIICNNVIEHVSKPRVTLSIFANLLNENGVLIINNLNGDLSEDAPMHFKLNFDYENFLNTKYIFKHKNKDWLWIKNNVSI